MAKLAGFADDVNVNGVGDIGVAGVKVKADIPVTNNGVTKFKPKEVTIPEGNIAAQYKMLHEELSSQSFGDIIKEADARGLLSADNALRKIEITTLMAKRDTALNRLEVEMESSLHKLLKPLEDSVDARSIIRQFKENAADKAVQFFAGAKSMSKIDMELLDGLTTGTAKGSVVLDLERGTLVSKPSGVSAFDLPIKERTGLVKGLEDSLIFTDSNVAGKKLTGMSGSLHYAKALDSFGSFTPDQALKELTLQANTTGYNLARDMARLEVLVTKSPNLDALTKVDGVEMTIGAAKQLIQERKIDIIVESINRGIAPEEISTMLHMPEAAIMNPQAYSTLIKGADDLSKPVATRYVNVVYDIDIRSLKPNRFELEAKTDVMKLQKLAREERDLAIARYMPSLNESGLVGKIPMDLYDPGGTATAIKYADSGIGSVFQETINLMSKIYDKAMRDAASSRSSQFKAAAERILAGGKTSQEYVELSAFNVWQRASRQQGGGIKIVLDPTGIMGTFAVRANVVDDLVKKAKVDKLEFANLSQLVRHYMEAEFEAGSQVITPSSKFMRLWSEDVVGLLLDHSALDIKALDRSNYLRSAKGQATVDLTNTDDLVHNFYDAPPSKAKNPFALVIKAKEGHQDPLYANHTYVHTFKDAQALQEFRAKAGDLGLNTYTIKETKDFYKGIEAYENAKAFDGAPIKKDLMSKGILTESLPGNESVEQMLARLNDWHVRDELAISRGFIELKHAEEFGRLKDISYMQAAERDSRFSVGSQIRDLLAKDKPTDGEKIINQLLNVQSTGVLNAITRTVDNYGNQFLSPLFTAIRPFKGKAMTADDMDKVAKEYKSLGIDDSIGNAIRAAMDVKPGVSDAWDKSIRLTNLAVATGQLRLDALNHLVTIIGAPVLSSSVIGLAIKDVGARMVKRGASEVEIKQFQELLNTEGAFGSGTINFMKLGHSSVKRTDKPIAETGLAALALNDKETIKEALTRVGIITNAAGAQMDMLANDALNLIRTEKHMAKDKVPGLMQKAWGIAMKPSDIVESNMQYLAADAALQIADAAKLPANETLALVNTIVQKLHGNFTSSQKPQIFQGTIGAAVGLFQAYQSRLIHRVLDVVDSGDKRMLMEMAALQSTIFGAKSLPGFDLVNKYLVAENNADKQDIYSGVFGMTNRKVAESLLYGVSSSVLGLNLSTRGAIDFRVPTGVTGIPAINFWEKNISGSIDFISQAAKGADISALIGHAIQHNTFSRPIQQAATWVQGYRTTMDGKVAVDINDPKFNNPDSWTLHSLGQFTRLAGGAPLDEAITLDTVYRWNAYRMSDREKNKDLGQVISTKLLGNEEITEADMAAFKDKYVSNGGTLEGFKSFYKNQINSTTKDSGERLRKLIKNSGEAKQLQIMLGGVAEEPQYQE
ncbi:MAG: hypothetical protein BWY21_01665 [Parcubacteria group bacterium ADurb.Bin216]|nr:MAG: hypothetical protein BWY21_01665 [Parcubacteria group bacterium ADurb.Bin216]